MGRLTDHVRAACAQLASDARSVRIDHERLAAYDAGADGPVIRDPGLDPVRHYLEGTPADVAMYTLALDTINFGSGWFPTLRKRMDPATGRTVSGYFTVAWNLADHFRAHGAWTTERPARAAHRGAGRDPRPAGRPRADEPLQPGAARAGALPRRRAVLDLVAEAEGSADRLAAMLAGALAFYDDRGFYKRAQIVPNDLALAGVAALRRPRRADDLRRQPRPPRAALRRDPGLRRWRSPRGSTPSSRCATGREEREIRACALHACEVLGARLDVPPRVLDMWLWNRGQAPALKARPRHRCRTVYY